MPVFVGLGAGDHRSSRVDTVLEHTHHIILNSLQLVLHEYRAD